MSDRPRPNFRPIFPRRLPLRLVAAAIAVGLWGACLSPLALGQSNGSIPGAVRDAPDTPDNQRQIGEFVDAQVAKLVGGDPAAVAAGREALIAQLSPPATSAAFKSVYAGLLAGRFETALNAAAPVAGAAPADDARHALARLNMAIVAERAARYTQSEKLGPLVAQLVGDAAPQVALWGVKAASPLLPVLLDNALARGRDPTVPAIVAAAKRFPDNGPLAEEIYGAFLLRILDRGSPPSKASLDNGVPVVLPAVLDVMGLRAGEYSASGKTPAEPLAEQDALVFVTHPAVWERQDATGRRRTVATLRDLMSAAAGSVQSKDQAQGQNRKDLMTLMSRIGSAFQAVARADGGGGGGKPLDQAAQTLARVNAGTPAEELQRDVADIEKALQGSYPDLPPRPEAAGGGADGSKPTNASNPGR